MMTFYIKVKDNRLEDVKFQTFGCVAAIAVSSMVSEMAKGKDLEEAKKITNKQVAEVLGGLPPNKLHCSNLGAEALGLAIKNYQEKGQAKA
jgi:nitrogen fixation NifU-like protein